MHCSWGVGHFFQKMLENYVSDGDQRSVTVLALVVRTSFCLSNLLACVWCFSDLSNSVRYCYIHLFTWIDYNTVLLSFRSTKIAYLSRHSYRQYRATLTRTRIDYVKAELFSFLGSSSCYECICIITVSGTPSYEYKVFPKILQLTLFITKL